MPTLQQAMLDIGTADKRRQAIRTKQAEAVEKAKATYADELADLDAFVEDYAAKVATYINANRVAILGNSKTVVTEAGEIATRALPDTLGEHDPKAVIDALKKKGLDAFLSVKTSLDTRALLKSKPVVKGLSYETGREQIVFTPVTSGAKVAVKL
jgi:phage host-nuclease inhibitor protein Gam